MNPRDLRIRLGCFLSLSLAVVACGGDDVARDGGFDASDGCPVGMTACDGVCRDVTNDRQNCGTCGATCDVGQICVDSACTVLCPAGQTGCDGACADTLTDSANCGGCGTACASGEACIDGACALSCPAGQSACGDACVDTESDPSHCGACDAACDPGDVCSEGACAANCGAGLMECSGACVGTMDDPLHCGACDNACPTVDGAIPACMGGACRLLCSPLAGDCNGDLNASGGDGCETALATDPANCGACGRTCTLDNAAAGCDAGGCVVTMCDTGFDDCDAIDANGCEAELAADSANCGTCGNACPAGERCNAGSCIPAVGEDCADPFVLALGTNSIAWAAMNNDYLMGSLPCTTASPDGPDVVLSYTATRDERITLSFDKPASTRWAAVTSTAACGTLSPRIACVSEFTADTMVTDFALTSGETAYVYVVDTDSGTSPLDNPLVVDVTSVACSDAPIPTLEPADGSTTSTLTPTFTVSFGAPILTTSGTFTITGDMGTSLSYDLLASPPEVSFSSANSVVAIDPGVTFAPGEQLTISWSGVQTVVCTTPVAVPAPTWVVNVIAPSCVPGGGGIVGSTSSRFAAPSAILSEYYVAADESPTGYVYFGGTSDLLRVPKGGGTVENVETLAGLTTSNLGYEMLVDGSSIYTLESSTTGTTGHLYRISTDGGATWLVEDYASFPSVPADDFRAAYAHGGRIYLATHEATTGVDTQIWSVDAAATTLPDTAVLEASVSGEGDCSAVARDDSFYYLACSDGDRLVRAPLTGGAATLITDAFDVSATNNSLYGDDTDGDGTFDVLYLQTWYEEIYYVCDPAGTPYADLLADVGGSSSNYGMGFDRTGNVLYMLDDDTDEIVAVQ